jgi:archaellum component FlaD/FlaE
VAKFKAWPNSGHLVIVPPAKRGEPATRYTVKADAHGIIETEDPAAIAQLRQGGVVEEIPEKRAVVEPPAPDKKTVEEQPERLQKRAVVEPPAPDKKTVEEQPERLQKRARGGKAPAGDAPEEGPDGAQEAAE